MGDPEGWPQPSGLLAEGSPFFAAEFPSSVDDEKWACAELRISELIECILPTQSSEKRRRAVAEYVQRLISKCFDCQVFTFGSVPLKTYLPDGDIDLTAFSKHQHLNETWANDVRSILEQEERQHNAEFRVKEVQYIHAEVKIVKCLVENIVVDISFNQLGGLCTLCFLEEVDRLIGQKHLFKRSIILIKAWCYYESRILGAHHGLISTYALETLVLYIFHIFHASLRGPLEVLFRFLDFFSNFDWDNYCVSLWGPVPLSSFPDLTVEPPRRDGGELLLSKEFLDGCSQAYAVCPGGQDTQGRSFTLKHLNVIDPLRTSNNLGRSVSKGNFFRIRSAFGYGARKLARILGHPKEQVVLELDHFFLNTWERHGSGRRPDVPDPLDQLHDSVQGLPLLNGIIPSKYEEDHNPENYSHVAEAHSIHNLSSASLSAEPDVLRSALWHVTRIFTGGTEQSSEASSEIMVAPHVPKPTKCEFSPESQSSRSEVGHLSYDEQNISKTDGSSLEGPRSEKKVSFIKEESSISSADVRTGDSQAIENTDLMMKVPVSRSSKIHSPNASFANLQSSAVITSQILLATAAAPLVSANCETTEKVNFVVVENENLSILGHHEMQKSVPRPNAEKFVNAFSTQFIQAASAPQINQVPLQLQGSIALGPTRQPSYVSSSSFGVSSGISGCAQHEVSSYSTFLLPRGPVPPPPPPYMGFIGFPLPNVAPLPEDLNNQFSSFLPSVDEELQEQEHNLWQQNEQVHEEPGGHLSRLTATSAAVAAPLIHSLPQLAISETLPFSESTVLPVAPFPVSGSFLPVTNASLNHVNMFMDSSTSLSKFTSQLGATTEQIGFSCENAEDEFNRRSYESVDMPSSRYKRGTQVEVDAGGGSEMVFKMGKDRTFGRGVALIDEEIPSTISAEDGYVLPLGEESTFFPSQSSFGHTIPTLPSYPHLVPSPETFSDPVIDTSQLHPLPLNAITSLGTSFVTESVMVPYSPFPSQFTAVPCVQPVPIQAQLPSLSGASLNSNPNSGRSIGSESITSVRNFVLHQGGLENTGAFSSSYFHMPYVAMQSSFPVYALPPHFDGTADLFASDGLQSMANLGNVNEFRRETADEFNLRLANGVGERLQAAGVPVSVGSRVEPLMEGSAEVNLQEGRLDPLSTDFAGHLRNLDYGRFCQNLQLHSPVMIQPRVLPSMPKHLQAHHSWEEPVGPLPSVSISTGHAARSQQGHVPLASAGTNSGRTAGSYRLIPGLSSSGDESPRSRRNAGGYWSSQRQNFFRDRQSVGRSTAGIQNQYHGEREGGPNFAPRHRTMARGQGRYEVRSQQHLTEDGTMSEEKITERVRDIQRQDNFSNGSMQFHYGVHPSYLSSVPTGKLLIPPPMATSLDMLPQIYMNNGSLVGASGANVPPVIVVYPVSNPMEFTSESLEYQSSQSALQVENNQVNHLSGRNNIRRQELAFPSNSAGSMSIPLFPNEIYLQPPSPTRKQRPSQRMYQLKEEDFPPLSFRAQQEGSS